MAQVVITGANRGIGLEMCKLFKSRGDDVVAACRKSSEALEATGVRVIDGIDVAEDGVAEKLQTALGDQKIDILINNAGILRSETIDDMNFESMRQQFEVNSLGPLRTTAALLGNLHEGSKIALITSRMGSVADNTSGSRYGYRMSKSALNIAGVSLAHDLKPKGVAVGILHPGWVKTEMTGNTGNATPSESASQLVERIDGLSLENTGTFWHANGDVLPW